MKPIFRTALATCAFAAISVAHAAFPERPITMVVPFAPGGAADALARVLAVRMGAKLGTSVVIDNRAGASGNIGAAFVARAKNDGYTLLYNATPYSINQSLYSKLQFSEKDFLPLTLVALAPNILVVSQASPIKDQADLVARAKASPGKLTFASGGSGTVQRLASELYRQRLGLDMLHVPYKSGGPAISDVMGGQVDFMFSTMSATAPLVSSGKLRALAVSSKERSPVLPSVPTVSESVLPGYEAYEWNGIMLPAGTPPETAETLRRTVVEVLKEEEVRKRFADLGAQPVGSTSADFAEFLTKDKVKWAEVVKKGNIQPD